MHNIYAQFETSCMHIYVYVHRTRTCTRIYIHKSSRLRQKMLSAMDKAFRSKTRHCNNMYSENTWDLNEHSHFHVKHKADAKSTTWVQRNTWSVTKKTPSHEARVIAGNTLMLHSCASVLCPSSLCLQVSGDAETLEGCLRVKIDRQRRTSKCIVKHVVSERHWCCTRWSMLYTMSWCIGHCVALLRVDEKTIRECNTKRWTLREHFNWWKWTQLSWWNVIMKRHVNVTWILKIVPLRLRAFVATQFQRWALGVNTRGCFRSSIL